MAGPTDPRPSPAPRQSWTVYVCPRCGHMDPDQHDRDPDRPRNCIFAVRGLHHMHPYQGEPGWNPEVAYEPVEVVPSRPLPAAGLSESEKQAIHWLEAKATYSLNAGERDFANVLLDGPLARLASAPNREES